MTPNIPNTPKQSGGQATEVAAQTRATSADLSTLSQPEPFAPAIDRMVETLAAPSATQAATEAKFGKFTVGAVSARFTRGGQS